MIIKNIVIDNFENINHLESPFDSKLTVLTGENAVSVIKAIGVILKINSIVSTIGFVQEKARIEAEIESGQYRYRIVVSGAEKTYSYDVFSDAKPPEADFYGTFQCNQEEKNLIWFHFDDEEPYSERLLFYKDPEANYRVEDFSKRTKGVGMTRSFRACLQAYMKGYRSTLLDEAEQRMQSESKKILLEFASYLAINDFWEHIEKIRDINHESFPILITELVEKIDRAADLTLCLEEAKKQNRQIIMGKFADNAEEKPNIP